MKRNGIAVLLILLVGMAFLVLGGGGYWLWQNQNLKTVPAPSGIGNSPTAAPSVIPSVTVEMSPTAVPTPGPYGSTVVVFESEAMFPAADKDQIIKRVINPYLDYYKDLQAADYVVSMKIRINTQASKNLFPYLADAIHRDGSNAGFTVEKDANGIKWWIPDCMGPCPMSESFKAKYPEIAQMVD